ncbi:MAG: two-component system copper resistance phosphate regulon response regulator CusR [Planctomycetota bacterium]|jgi:two-component system copper resistance phosphate regulon response regulator CusR
MRILIVEDYPPVRNAIATALRESGYTVDETGNGETGLELATTREYDVVVLDLMLPGMDGTEVLERIRVAGNDCRVLIVTARGTVEDRIKGLDLGADDYMVKPFPVEELLARVRALIRRGYGKSTPIITLGHLEIDTNSHAVRSAGERVTLTAKEYSLLEYLVLRAGQLVTRSAIFEHVYKDGSTTNSNVIDVYMTHLRKKLERSEHPKLIHTRRGEGYIMSEEAP